MVLRRHASLVCVRARVCMCGGLKSPIQVHGREYCTQGAHVLFFYFFNPIEPYLL